jgi:hypothetical protein
LIELTDEAGGEVDVEVEAEVEVEAARPPHNVQLALPVVDFERDPELEETTERPPPVLPDPIEPLSPFDHEVTPTTGPAPRAASSVGNVIALVLLLLCCWLLSSGNLPFLDIEPVGTEIDAVIAAPR